MTLQETAKRNIETCAWLLQEIYSGTGGDLQRAAALAAIKGERPWREIDRAANYLARLGLAQWMGRGKLRLTAAGAAAVERTLSTREEVSATTPLVQHFHGAVGAVQNAAGSSAFINARPRER